MSEQDKQCREALLPCPFCGSQPTTSLECGEFLVTCQTCESSAWIDHWNLRTPQAQLTDDEIIKIAHEMRTHFMGYNNIDLLNFAKAIAARCGGEQAREKKDLNTNAESFRRAVDAMQKEKK